MLSIRHLRGPSIPANKTRCLSTRSLPTKLAEQVQSHGQKEGRKEAKQSLLQLIADTGRGFRATLHSRGAIEEAQLGVEKFAGEELDYNLLEGQWKLLFTTAADVVSLFHGD